jgi:hypothetical protein
MVRPDMPQITTQYGAEKMDNEGNNTDKGSKCDCFSTATKVTRTRALRYRYIILFWIKKIPAEQILL